MTPKENKDSISVFVDRLKKLGIEIKVSTNYPWIYLDRVNDNLINDKWLSDYGFTLAFYPRKETEDFYFTDINKIFKIIRENL
jgi:hypothetical protein